MSENLRLGQIITDEQYRDAVHIAVAPTMAGERLMPGDHVALMNGEAMVGVGKPVGIVDPFLKTSVKAGQKFWLYLYPGSITSLRHEWTHPAFGGPQPPPNSSRSEEWIRNFADSLGVKYEDLMEAARNWIAFDEHWSGGYTTDLEGDSYSRFQSTPDLPDEFWDHFQEVTGGRVKSDKRENFFTCSC